jgi:predicted dinucleotide-binding enzyme
MRDPKYDGASTMMLFAGDDAESKALARRLATDLGFEAIDAGGLAAARHLEHLAMLWISLAFGGGGAEKLGRSFAFRVVRR